MNKRKEAPSWVAPEVQEEMARQKGGLIPPQEKGGVLKQVGIGVAQGFNQIGEAGWGALEAFENLPGSSTPNVRGIQGYKGFSPNVSELRKQASSDIAALEAEGERHGGPAIARKLAAGAVSVIPAIAASPGGLGVAATAAGLQSFGSTYGEALDGYIGLGVSEEEAKKKAFVPAIGSGLVTSALTMIGGKTGPEALKSLAVNRSWRTVAKNLVKEAGGEATEEGVDQLLQGAIAMNSYNPDLSWEDALKQSAEAAAIGGVLGAGFSAAGKISARNEPRVDVEEKTSPAPSQEGSAQVKEENLEISKGDGKVDESLPEVQVDSPARPITETTETLQAQTKWLMDGKRDAVLFTNPETVPENIPEGLELHEGKEGIYLYNPEKTDPEIIDKAEEENRVGDVLGYGIPNKPANEDVAGVVTVRDENGIEKQAVVTDETNKESVLKRATEIADEGDSVQIEPAEKVVGERLANLPKDKATKELENQRKASESIKENDLIEEAKKYESVEDFVSDKSFSEFKETVKHDTIPIFHNKESILSNKIPFPFEEKFSTEQITKAVEQATSKKGFNPFTKQKEVVYDINEIKRILRGEEKTLTKAKPKYSKEYLTDIWNKAQNSNLQNQSEIQNEVNEGTESYSEQEQVNPPLVNSLPDIDPRITESVNNLAKSWSNSPNINIVNSLEDLPDTNPNKTWASQYSKIEGFYDPNSNEVFLFSKNLKNPERAQEVLLHEVVGHHGLNKVLSNEDYSSVMDKAWKLVEKEGVDPQLLKRGGYESFEQFLSEYNFDTNSDYGRRAAMEELLARAAEINRSMPTANWSWFKEVVAALKQILNQKFPSVFSENDTDKIVSLLGQSKKYVKGKAKGTQTQQTAPKIKTVKVKNQSYTESKNPIPSDGKQKKSRAYQRFKERVGDVLKSETEDDPLYHSISLAEDASKAIDFVEQYPEEAKKIALGLKEAPQGITETAISIAISEKALLQGDYKNAAKMVAARSLRQTRRGREIVAERGQFGKDSPQTFIKQVLNLRMREQTRFEFDQREGKLNKKITEKVSKEAREQVKAINKRAANIQSAQDVINSLLC